MEEKRDEKRVELSDEQYRVLRKTFRSHAELGEVLRHLLISLLDEIEQRQDKIWDQVAELLGFASIEDANLHGYQLVVQWLTKSVVARPHVEKEKTWRQVAAPEDDDA